jgi:hypothetical protein
MAATSQILVWTILLFCGQVLPFLLLTCPAILWSGGLHLTIAAVALSYGVRAHAAVRFRSSWLGEVLHPLGVVVLMAIQWYAVYRAAVGRPLGWKGRAHPVGT